MLQEQWGYDDFRGHQAAIIANVLQGHDTLGLMPTGGGKSVTFQVPALMLPGITLVVTPLVSLMKDQVDNLHARDIKAYCLYAGMNRSQQRLAYDRCRLGKCKLLYIAPERIKSQSFIEQLRQWEVSLIVADEAHCISQWGYDFRPSYLEISKLRELFPEVPVLAVTASATPQVQKDIVGELRFRHGWRLEADSFARNNLAYAVRIVDNKLLKLEQALANVPGTAIVYVRSRRRCKEMSDYLLSRGFVADYYHAGLNPVEKTQRQDAWKSGKTRIIVATNAFGMGIDKADVRLVVHFDLPPSIEEYYQEAGRAGRDGKPSYALTIARTSDRALLKRRLAETFPPKDKILDTYQSICAFVGVPMGEGYECAYQFNLPLFCQRFKANEGVVRSALAILEASGYMALDDSPWQQGRVMIVAKRDDLYNQLLTPEADSILNALLRRYSGLFADFVPIQEEQLALDTGLTPEDVYQAMLLMQRLHLLSYVPRSTVPLIYMLSAREESRHICIPRTVYEVRREQMSQRLKAVANLVFGRDNCRQQTILKYFGEEHPGKCGKCDICREGAKRAPNVGEIDFDEIEKTIVEFCQLPFSFSPRQIISGIKPQWQVAATEVLEQMLESGYLTKTPDGNVVLADQRRGAHD